MHSIFTKTVADSTRKRRLHLRETVLGLFGDQSADAALQLWEIDQLEWEHNLFWLDASGLALYLLARTQELGVEYLLPGTVLQKLRGNAADNRVRTASLLEEMSELTARFQAAGVPFAFLKGLTLVPGSVPDPTHRCQMDLDIVAAWEDASGIRELLGAKGYTLHAEDGGTWEFKTVTDKVASITQLYQVRPQRTIEVHWIRSDRDHAEQRRSIWRGQLQRARLRKIGDSVMPALAPEDLFLNQAMHLFGHLRGEYTRASWILELARHIRSRSDDADFWRTLRKIASEVEQATLGCGVALAATQRVLGQCAPAEVMDWCVSSLPVEVRLWVGAYATRIAVADVPGTKLYLLLESALATGGSDRSLRFRRLVPLRLPPMIAAGMPGGGMMCRVRHFAVQLRFVLLRLRFHVKQAAVYGMELRRWERLKRTHVAGQTDPLKKSEPDDHLRRLQRNDIRPTGG